MTFSRLVYRYPTLDRAPIAHTFRLIFDAVTDLEITWTHTGTGGGAVTRHSGLSLIGLVRTKVR